jgi:FAD/FMN-containing dehydrogenase
LPEDVHGRTVIVFPVCHVGEAGKAERALAPLRTATVPIADTVGPQPYAGWQTAFDPLLAPGARNYWKSHDLEQLDDGLLDVIVAHAALLPTPESEVFLPNFGGAMGHVPPDATAFPHRRMRFLLNIHARWRDSAADGDCIAWARSFAAAAAPFGTGGAYVNFMPADEADRLTGAYGDSYPRLAALKARYDPANLFRGHHNLRPAA